jgi:diacylglycerol kinase (ATP)
MADTALARRETASRRARKRATSSSRRRPLEPSRVSRRVVLVGNGVASGLRDPAASLEQARQALIARGACVEAHLTGGVDELAAVLARAEGRRVVLLGGDGTVHEAANLPGPRPELALLPAGRANNVARSLGIPTEPRAAARVAVERPARGIDLIEARSREARRLVVEGVSVGFHAIARAGYHSPNSADVAAGFRAALAAARRFDGVDLSLLADEMPLFARVGQLFAANLPLYAFGLRVAPFARPDDGKLDLVALEATNRASIVPMLVRLRRGTHVARRDTYSLAASRVRIDTRGGSPVIADTVNLGTGPVELRVAQRALKLAAPA